VSIPDRRWLAGVYGSVLVPVIGPALLVVASSVLYFRWRHADPQRAAWLNKHVWLAFLGNAAIVVALRHVLGR
jgi:hypothetical protein